MGKRHVSFGNEKLKWLCNEAFYLVKGKLPKNLRRDETKLDKRLAGTFGLLSGYGAACFGKHVIYPFVQQFANDQLGVDIPLEHVAGYCLTATVAGSVIPRMVAPRFVHDWKYRHPTYSSGVGGVMTGASLKALVELVF